MTMAMLVLTSCNKDNEPNYSTNTSLSLNAYNQWVYLNLKTGESQTVKDFTMWNYINRNTKQVVETIPGPGKESDIKIKWDIAFHRSGAMKTNSAEAAETDAKNLAELKNIPTTGFVKDVEVKNEVLMDVSRAKAKLFGYSASCPVNKTLMGGFTKKMKQGMPPYDLIPTNKVFAIKTKDGSMYKIIFLNAQDSEGNAGVTLQWARIKAN